MNTAKNIKTAAVVLALALTTFSQASNAATVSLNPVDDITVAIPQGYGTGSAGDPLDISYLKTQDGLVSFLKFNISSVKSKVITSAKLKIFGNGLGTAEAKYVDNDAFVDETVNIPNPFSQAAVDALQSTVLGSVPVSAVESWHEITLDLADLLADIATIGDNHYSLALSQTGLFQNAEFNSSESASNPPVLELVYEPGGGGIVPEPSSMLLGLLGLGGALSARRKKA